MTLKRNEQINNNNNNDNNNNNNNSNINNNNNDNNNNNHHHHHHHIYINLVTHFRIPNRYLRFYLSLTSTIYIGVLVKKRKLIGAYKFRSQLFDPSISSIKFVNTNDEIVSISASVHKFLQYDRSKLLLFSVALSSLRENSLDSYFLKCASLANFR